MIKFREARYCNLKLFLIFLVIYGHLVETQIDGNALVLVQYKAIYLFHMPAFAFLSGLFVRSRRFCVIQLKRVVLLYGLLQTVCVICGGGKVDWFTPCWILWYLLSLCWWFGAAWCLWKTLKGKGGWLVLVAALVIGCMAGYIEEIGRMLSFSRSLVFFPYFWWGVLMDSKTDWKRYRVPGAAAFCISVVVFLLCHQHLPVEFLYQASPYGEMLQGAVLRMLCYMLGVAVLLFLLAWTPDRRFLFTKAGADTMDAYLFHGVFAVALRKLMLPWQVYALITGGFLWTQCRILQIAGKIYGITQTGNRREDNRCLTFRRYMKKMQENCMDSCFRSPETKY